MQVKVNTEVKMRREGLRELRRLFVSAIATSLVAILMVLVVRDAELRELSPVVLGMSFNQMVGAVWVYATLLFYAHFSYFWQVKVWILSILTVGSLVAMVCTWNVGWIIALIPCLILLAHATL